MSEIELKLTGSPAGLKAAAARLAKKAVDGSSFANALRAVYFDTAKDDLHAKGLAFRVREQNGRFVQTLKQSKAGDDALTRGEWSDDIAGAAPELLATKSGRKLRKVWKDVRLLPRFRTDIQRHGFMLRPRRGTEIEVVRDEGEIRVVGRDEEPIRVSEIELELKKGSPAAVYRLALEILSHTKVQVEPRAKSDRGYRLQSPGARIEAVKADTPAVHKRDALVDVLRSAARRHFGQFLANIPGALAQDPASIHQMRVAMRRLRSAVYAMRELLPEKHYESVRMKLKYLLQVLGPARDWEVLSERISELDGEEELKGAAVGVKTSVKAHRREALMGVASALGSQKNTRTMLEAMLWFEDLPTSRHGRALKVRAGDAAPRLLDELFSKVARRARRFARQSVGDRHRLRIACKNLRYNIDLYGALFGARKAGGFLKRLKAVQDDLGQLNDVSRARELLGDLVERSPQKAAARSLIVRLEQRVISAEKRARKHVAALTRARRFWT